MQSSKTIIGLVGEIGSGKGTVVELFEELLPNARIIKLKFSAILADVLDVLHIPKTRDNLQKLAIIIDETYGEGTFAHAMEERIRATDADIIFVDGMRWPADERLIITVGGVVMYITADQRTRYERITQRGEKVGETDTTFEQFQHQESMKNETFIKDIGSRAQFVLHNDKDLATLRSEVVKIIEALGL